MPHSPPAPELVSVCLPLPVRTSFTYRVPAPLAAGIVPGRRVRVPFGPRSMVGWCVGFPEPVAHPMGLPQGQRAPTSADADGGHEATAPRLARAASSTRSIARSSCAADTNIAS